MGRIRSGEGRRVTSVDGGGGGGSRRVPIIIGVCVVAFLVGFAALVLIDSNQNSSGGSPPDGVQTFDESGGVNNHTTDDVTHDQTPPAGGPHNPVWQNQGFYEEPVRDENAVHTLEHGAVWITYDPDLPQDQKDALRQIVQGQDCLIASPFPDLPDGAPMVASAWGAQMQLTGTDDPNLERFIGYYRKGPQTPEPGATCAGGIGSPS